MKKIIFVFLLLITTSSYARYEFYECNLKNQTSKCAEGCSKIKTGMPSMFSYEFKVNPSTNSVIIDYYDNVKGYVESKALKYCTVIDAKNWICEQDKQDPDYLGVSMHNGIYNHNSEKFSSDKPRCWKNSFIN